MRTSTIECSEGVLLVIAVLLASASVAIIVYSSIKDRDWSIPLSHIRDAFNDIMPVLCFIRTFLYVMITIIGIMLTLSENIYNSIVPNVVGLLLSIFFGLKLKKFFNHD